MTVEQKISRARTRLLLDSPWFGSLAMRLRIESCPDIKTFDVDGSRMRYNPQFADSLSDENLTAVLAHEVMHCALLHPYRRNGRDAKQWNQACDYAINSELQKSGFKLPADCLLDAQYAGMSSEAIYSKLGQKPQQQNGGQGQGQGQGQGESEPSTGSVSDSPEPGQGQTPESGQMTASDWQIATEQANAVTRAAGKMPGGLEETVRANQANPEDWRAILREFVEHTVPKDYSWTHPNRRHIANGIYLPGMMRENLGHLVIAVDTSGSINTRLLETFSREVNAITQEAKPDRVTVIYCDTKINRVCEFEQDSTVELTAVGRGGTFFSPVFDHVQQMGESPVCLIYFTDLDNADGQITEPDYPVLWAVSEHVRKDGQFGRTVRVSEYQ